MKIFRWIFREVRNVIVWLILVALFYNIIYRPLYWFGYDINTVEHWHVNRVCLFACLILALVGVYFISPKLDIIDEKD